MFVRAIIFFLAGCPGLALAQVKPEFLPEDVTTDQFREVRCYCEPGVRYKSASKGLEISYTRNGASTYRPEGTPMSAPYSATSANEQFLFGLKIPLVNRPQLKILTGLKYVQDEYHFRHLGTDFSSVFGELDRINLKNISYDLIVSRPLNDSYYGGLRVKYGFAGNFDGLFNFNRKNRIISALALFGSKRDQDREWGLGLTFSTSFRRTIFLPVFVWNRNFSSKWGLEMTLPVNVFLRRNLDSRTLLLGGLEYSSQSYRLTFDEPTVGEQDYALNYSAILASLSLERRLFSWIGLYVKGGYQNNFSTDFKNKSSNTPGFDAEPSAMPFVKVGLFVAKPR